MADTTRVATMVENLDDETIAQIMMAVPGDRSVEAGTRVPEEADMLDNLMA